MRRSRVIVVVLAVALLGGMLALGVWRGGRRREAAAPVAEEGAATAVPAAPPSSAQSVPPKSTLRPEVAPGAAPATDDQLLAGIRAQVRSDPRKAESLAREARTRFPNSPHADEWDALLVDALVNQERIGAARSETYYYYDHHPDGAFAARLFALTGAHPTPARPGPR